MGGLRRSWERGSRGSAGGRGRGSAFQRRPGARRQRRPGGMEACNGGPAARRNPGRQRGSQPHQCASPLQTPRPPPVPARDAVVIATKAAGPSGQMPWIRGGPASLDAPNITAALDGSLRRLGVDCIDLYQLHWPDRWGGHGWGLHAGGGGGVGVGLGLGFHHIVSGGVRPHCIRWGSTTLYQVAPTAVARARGFEGRQEVGRAGGS
jgi:hypothetical protein